MKKQTNTLSFKGFSHCSHWYDLFSLRNKELERLASIICFSLDEPRFYSDKSRRDSRGLIHSQGAFQLISERRFPGSDLISQENWTTQGGMMDSNHAPRCPVMEALGGARGEMRWEKEVWDLGWAISLWHFCTLSRWEKRTLICSMSHELYAKGTSSLASIQRLAVSLGPINKACVISLSHKGRKRLALWKLLRCVLLEKTCLGL